jgi:quinol monooxygenase YgiN
MTTELRLYTVNKGMMDEWLEAFQKYIMPTSAKFGIKIHFGFVNRSQNEFIWSRSYDSSEALEAYMKSPDRAAYADITGRCIAKTEVRQVDLALGAVSVANLEQVAT